MTETLWKVHWASSESALVNWDHCSQQQPSLYCILYYKPGGHSTIDVTDGSSTSHELEYLSADTYVVVLISTNDYGINTAYIPALLTRSECVKIRKKNCIIYVLEKIIKVYLT